MEFEGAAVLLHFCLVGNTIAQYGQRWRGWLKGNEWCSVVSLSTTPGFIFLIFPPLEQRFCSCAFTLGQPAKASQGSGVFVDPRE